MCGAIGNSRKAEGQRLEAHATNRLMHPEKNTLINWTNWVVDISV